MVMALTVFGKKGDPDAHCFGYRAFNLGGKPVTSQFNDSPVLKTVISNTETNTLETKLSTTANPLTLVIHEFDPKFEAHFRFTVWFKHS